MNQGTEFKWAMLALILLSFSPSQNLFSHIAQSLVSQIHQYFCLWAFALAGLTDWSTCPDSSLACFLTPFTLA